MKRISTILFSFIPVLLLSQNSEQLVKNAEILYQKNEFVKAAVLFRKASNEKRGDALIFYNLGIAEFKAGNYDNSLKAFENSIKFSVDPKLKSQSLYNLGNAYAKKNSLEDAVNCFRQALIFAPDDKECRENLQLALNDLKKEQDEDRIKDKDERTKNKENKKEVQSTEKTDQSLSRKDLEIMLQNLQLQENKLRDSLRNSRRPVRKSSDKDW